jgi:hypothetical protein
MEKLESKGMVQLFEEAGINYVKFIGSTMNPVELQRRPTRQYTSLDH